MAKTMSMIRYKYKADRDYESIQFEGMSCSLGELKRLIIEKSSRSESHHPKHDYDLIISNSTTHEEYKDSSDLIPRNTSVVVARRIRGTFESLTPSSTQKSIVSSDDIVKEYLLPAMSQSTQMTISSVITNSPSIVESKAIPLEMLTQPSTTMETTELNEDERIKEIVKTSRSQYLPSHRSNNSYTCHNCKQPGHLRNHCPLLLQSSSTNSNANGNPLSSSSGKSNNTKSTSHHHHYHHHHHGNRLHHRGPGHTRNEPIPKNSTGIPRGSLIHIPKHIPGAFRDQSGASVVPRQMAQLIVENSEKKADALAQRARQFQEKGVLPPAPPPSMLPTKSAEEDLPPKDLLCSICKQLYNDAVITPCCHNSFCDECIRTALIESEEHECPHCHRQHVAIDQINPNLFLRKTINNWLEEQQRKSSYPYVSSSSSIRSSGLINTQLSNDSDDDDDVATSLPIVSQPTVKTAPIVIRMQPLGRDQPSPVATTKPSDMAFDNEKGSFETDQTTFSQKDTNSQFSIGNNDNIGEEISNTETDTNTLEDVKSDRKTPPSQLRSVNTILSSPPTTTTTTATTMSTTPSIIPHYYPNSSHQQHMHHNVIYPPIISPTSSTNFYPIHHNYYPPPIHLSYPGVHPSFASHSIVPPGGYHHYPPPPHHHHPIYPHTFNGTHLQPNPINGFHVTHYETANVSSLHHPGTTYAATSTSTLISHHHHHHHETTTQTVPKPIEPTLSKDELYSKQRKRSTSRHRPPSSYSSYTSSDSRNSPFTRRSSQNRNHRRDDSRKRSPKRRSSPVASKPRQRTPPRNDYHSSKSRKLSPPRSCHSTRERRRSPRPPPTIQQSTQRTIVYMHESSSSSSKQHSDQNHDQYQRKTRSSRNEDRTTSPLQSSSSIKLPSEVRPKTLASRIETVINEKRSTSILSNSSNKISSCKETNPNNEKKRKKHHHHEHHKKHRHSKSKNNEDNHTATKAITSETVSIIEA